MNDLRRLPPFPALRAFHAAARHLKLRAAAEELGVTESAVSHQLRKLENYLHVQLFDRTNHQLKLTDAGRRYFYGIDQAISILHDSTEGLVGAANTTRVVVTLPPTLVTLWLIPRLPGFEAACPGIDLQLVPTTRVCDLSREQIDLAIRYGFGAWDDVHSERLLSEVAMPVCAPDFLGDEQKRQVTKTLDEARLLVNELHPEEWSEWASARGLRVPEMKTVMSFPSTVEVLEAASRGLGLAMGRSPAADEHLASKELIAPFAGAPVDTAHYYLCHPLDAELSAPARKVARWLKQLAEETRLAKEMKEANDLTT